MTALRAPDLLLVRAALQAGAMPGEALQAAATPGGPLAAISRALRSGTTLPELAAAVDGPTAPLVRAMAAAELAGAAAGSALDGLVEGVLAHERLARLVDVRAADARLTARVLLALPILGVVLTTVASRGARTFLASTLGVAVLALAGAMMLAAVAWMRRLVAGVARAARDVDPLIAPAGGSRHPTHRAAAGAGGRPAAEATMPTAESMELLAIGLTAGQPLLEATRMVARIGPPPARAAWTAVAGALRAGASPAEALTGALTEVGTVVDVTRRWGAPAAPALRLLARDLQARAEAAAEAAAERLAAQLVFPTTLLLVPAFGLLVVSPLVAAAFGGASLGVQP